MLSRILRNLEVKQTHYKWMTFFIVALAIFIRSLPFKFVFENGRVYLYESDSYLHMRKILMHIENFPNFVTYDYFEGYPVGIPAIKPPLLDYLLSVASLIIGLGNPTVRQAEVIAALCPPLIGGITIVVVYLFAKNLFNKDIALISSLILALMPSHIVFTYLGRPDNEMMEPLMVTLVFLFYIRLQKDIERNNPTALNVIYLSIASLFTMLFWRGAIVWIMILAVAFLIEITLDFIKNKKNARYLYGAEVFLLLTVYLFFICYFNVWGTQNSFRFNIISWFHTIIFGLTAVSIVTYGFLCKFWIGKNYKKYKLFTIIILMVIIVASYLFTVPSFKDNITKGLGVIGIGKVDPWLESIMEYQPLFNMRDFTFKETAVLFGWLFWLLPLIFIYMAIDVSRNSGGRSKMFFLFVTFYIITMVLFRKRFMHILAVNVAISGGWFLYTTYGILKDKILRGNRFIALASTVVIAIVVFYPFGIIAYSLNEKPVGFRSKGHIEDAMLWLKNNTPATEKPLELGYKPPYSVMARWEFGSWISYIAERAAIATVYGSEAYGHQEAAGFYIAESEPSANSIMDKTGARYVIVTKVIGDLDTFAQITGAQSGDYFELVYSDQVGKKIYNPKRKYYNLISTRLLMTDGMDVSVGDIKFKSVAHYRLVYESDEKLNFIGFPFEVKKLKIFEYLPGAAVHVVALPGEQVLITAKGITNRGRLFTFSKEKVAGSDGMATFVLTYPKRNMDNATGLVTPYKIKTGDKSKTVNLTEADVRTEREFVINFLKN